MRNNFSMHEAENGWVVVDVNDGNYKEYICSSLGEAFTRIKLLVEIQDPDKKESHNG